MWETISLILYLLGALLVWAINEEGYRKGPKDQLMDVVISMLWPFLMMWVVGYLAYGYLNRVYEP